jgi:hypothetical protein
MEMKSAEIEIARDSFYSWDYHIYAGIEISILEILVHFTPLDELKLQCKLSILATLKSSLQLVCGKVNE